ncbi:MAG: hypothetical protein IH898_02010, partial [Planctomycetes bacterium]|nr:hypothetical protein [Planctomycetota bacterium]
DLALRSTSWRCSIEEPANGAPDEHLCDGTGGDDGRSSRDAGRQRRLAYRGELPLADGRELRVVLEGDAAVTAEVVVGLVRSGAEAAEQRIGWLGLTVLTHSGAIIAS